ncbi:MAG: hypothetical protein IK057_05120 [Clostridia bacterium]|nr:hypothetical protein [Clostridia bacterium]
MKKSLSFIAAICVFVASVSASAACNIKISGNTAKPLCNIASYNSNGSTMVPFRSICEALGAKVNWNSDTNTASAECCGKTVSVSTGGNQIATDSGTVTLPTPSCNKDGLTYVPLRAICEALGCDVNWDANSGNISIEPPENTDCEDCETDTNCADGSCNNTVQNGNYTSLQDIINNFFGKTNNNSGNNQTTPQTPVTPAQPETQNIGGYQAEVLRLVNEQRANYGLSALTYNTKLESVAYAHSKDMAVNNYFSHTNLSGQSPFDRMKAAGISYRSAAENIAAGQKTPQEVVNAWMNSSGHRANILNSSVSQMGVGIYSGGSYGVYWTQLFIG